MAAYHPYDQDIDMPAIAAMARRHQPGLLIVDRSVPGPYENYRTPEQTVPAHAMEDPWESCITMGNSWSYVPHDHYKSAAELVQLLIKVVSRGGNLLLNIGPSPAGDWGDTAYARLREVGAWMAVDSEAIYGTHPVQPYASGNIFLTQSKDNSRTYAFYLGDPTHPDVTLPAEISIDRFSPPSGATVTVLGAATALQWHEDHRKMIITVPEVLRDKPAGK